MTPLLWIPIAYLFGALPLSLWIGFLAGVDIRQVGDGNPGATNVLRAAGKGWFLLALIADISKAAIPVGLAFQIWQWRSWEILLIALAPSIGHAFSVFLGFRGGKALASMLGTWIGLTLWELPLVAIVFIAIFFTLLAVDGWAVLLTTIGMLLYLIFFSPDPFLITILVWQIILICWTHRHEIQQMPRIRQRWLKSSR